jgi:hypothetical protein
LFLLFRGGDSERLGKCRSRFGFLAYRHFG